MPAVFVHGVPETHRLWDKVLARLSRKDVIALDLPGFDSLLPAGFEATKEAYAAWLAAELEKIGGPVDLVGHDWGSLLTLRVTSVRPDLIRTWVAGGGAIDADYTWHDVARIWQTPGTGEQFMTGMNAAALEAAMTGAGVPKEDASTMGVYVDDTMKDCILKLYRSAVEVGKEWQPEVDKISRPGMLIWGRDDPYMPRAFAEKLAARVKARFLTFDDCGHWWPLERPQETAAALEEFWRTAA